MEVSKDSPTKSYLLFSSIKSLLMLPLVPEPPSLGIGRRITVSVLPSDDAYGVFSFTDDSVSVLAQEHRTVLLTVQRVGGLLGNVTVYWEAHGNYSMDVNPSAGEVTFLEEASLEIISITIVNDTVSEHLIISSYS